MKNVAVIGAGTMGNGIAHVFAQFGYNVSLIDISQASLDKGIATITKNLDRQVAKESITEADKTATLNNLKTFTSMEEGVKNVELVVEAATDVGVSQVSTIGPITFETGLEQSSAPMALIL